VLSERVDSASGCSRRGDGGQPPELGHVHRLVEEAEAVAPSPKKASATRGSERIEKASAAPVAMPMPAHDRARPRSPLDVVQVHRAAAPARAALELAVELGHNGSGGAALATRAHANGCVEVITSRGDSAAQAPTATGLLADREVDEAGISPSR